jgi:predicted nucleotidyltransferase
MVDPSVVAITQKYLRALQNDGVTIRFGVLFGSWKHGRVNAWSDIDLVVVSPRFDHSHSWTDVRTLWRHAARVDSRIEPIACGERQWEEDNSSVILDVARREGERIFPENAAPRHQAATLCQPS